MSDPQEGALERSLALLDALMEEVKKQNRVNSTLLSALERIISGDGFDERGAELRLLWSCRVAREAMRLARRLS